MSGKEEIKQEPKEEIKQEPKQEPEQDPKHEPKEEPNADEVNVFNFEEWFDLINPVIVDSQNQSANDSWDKLKVHFERIENENKALRKQNSELKAQLEEKELIENFARFGQQQDDANNDEAAVELDEDNKGPTTQETIENLKRERDDISNRLFDAIRRIETLSNENQVISMQRIDAIMIANIEPNARDDSEFQRMLQALNHEEEIGILNERAANLRRQIRRYRQLSNRIVNEGRKFNSFIDFYARNARFFWNIAPELGFTGRGAGAKAASDRWSQMSPQEKANYRVISLESLREIIRQLEQNNQ